MVTFSFCLVKLSSCSMRRRSSLFTRMTSSLLRTCSRAYVLLPEAGNPLRISTLLIYRQPSLSSLGPLELSSCSDRPSFCLLPACSVANGGQSPHWLCSMKRLDPTVTQDIQLQCL